jgi:hypothetical protein
MTARAFALCFIGFVMALLAGTMAVNVTLDPEAVFDPGIAGQRLNANTRYIRFLRYRDGHERPDGVLFASSRGYSFELDGVARRLQVNAVANFAVNFGMLTDHLPALEYLLQDKARRGERLRAVFLMIDVDHFGKVPWTNVNLDGILPPQISGEHPARFWWRYLTAFQFRVWHATIEETLKRAQLTTTSSDTPVTALNRLPSFRAGVMPPLTLPATPFFREIAQARPARQYDIVQRPKIDAHLALLARMAELCRKHDISLTVVTSPLNRRNAADYDPLELQRVVDRISRVVPVWDFGAPEWLSDRPELWDDPSHFKREVSHMMLDRVFGPVSSAPADFGILRKP